MHFSDQSPTKGHPQDHPPSTDPISNSTYGYVLSCLVLTKLDTEKTDDLRMRGIWLISPLCQFSDSLRFYYLRPPLTLSVSFCKHRLHLLDSSDHFSHSLPENGYRDELRHIDMRQWEVSDPGVVRHVGGRTSETGTLLPSFRLPHCYDSERSWVLKTEGPTHNYCGVGKVPSRLKFTRQGCRTFLPSVFFSWLLGIGYGNEVTTEKRSTWHPGTNSVKRRDWDKGSDIFLSDYDWNTFALYVTTERKKGGRYHCLYVGPCPDWSTRWKGVEDTSSTLIQERSSYTTFTTEGKGRTGELWSGSL